MTKRHRRGERHQRQGTITFSPVVLKSLERLFVDFDHPLRVATYDTFARASVVVALCEPDDIETVFVTEDGSGGVQVYAVRQAEDPDAAFVADLFEGHRFGAMATRVSWAPDAARPFALWWSICLVERGRVGRIVMAHSPTVGVEVIEVVVSDAAWFQASTIGAIRAQLDGVVLPFRRARDGDSRLFGFVTDGDLPPTHEDGMI